MHHLHPGVWHFRQRKLKFGFNLIENIYQLSTRVLDRNLWLLFCGGLTLYFDFVDQGMWFAISCEPDRFIFQKLHPD